MKKQSFYFRASADNMGLMPPIIKRSERNEKTKFFISEQVQIIWG
jgi:hypothetical protein